MNDFANHDALLEQLSQAQYEYEDRYARLRMMVEDNLDDLIADMPADDARELLASFANIAFSPRLPGETSDELNQRIAVTLRERLEPYIERAVDRELGNGTDC